MNFEQIFSCLPKESQQALRVLQYMQAHGLDMAKIGYASKEVLHTTWNATRFTNAMRLAQTSYQALSATNATMAALITEGVELGTAATAATATGIGAWLTGLLGLVLLAGGTYIAAKQLGRLSADKPVKAGPALATRPAYGNGVMGRQDRPAPVAKEHAYYIVKLNRIYSVRTQAELDRGIPWVGFRHGGLSQERAPAVPQGSAYPTPQAATTALANLLEKGSFRPANLAAGWTAKCGSETVTIDDRGSVDMGLLRSIVQP
jgi:hypothetical protein